MRGMMRIMVDLDEDMVAEAMRIYGAKTKAAAVRAAMEDSVKRHLRHEFADAVKSNELDLREIVESTGPRNAAGSLQRPAQGDGN
jgi:Arc/MetJ family transcription regulator